MLDAARSLRVVPRIGLYIFTSAPGLDVKRHSTTVLGQEVCIISWYKRLVIIDWRMPDRRCARLQRVCNVTKLLQTVVQTEKRISCFFWSRSRDGCNNEAEEKGEDTQSKQHDL